MLFNVLITFSLVSGIKCEYTCRVIVESLCPMYLLTVCIGTFWDSNRLQYVCLNPWQETGFSPHSDSNCFSHLRRRLKPRGSL